MYIVLRRYADHIVLNAITARQTDVEQVVRGVPVFVSYYAVRSGTGA